MSNRQAPTPRPVGVGTDHAGIELKNRIVAYLQRQGIAAEDFGVHSPEPSDYPDIAVRVAEAVAAGRAGRGILVCGAGIGMCIAANKVRGIRAALCTSVRAAELSRAHNDANVLVIAGRDAKGEDDPFAIIDKWLAEPFSGAARHARRIAKIHAYEDARDRGNA